MMQELAQEIEETARAAIDNVHTALPGKIDKFDPSTCTATATPIGTFQISTEEELEYPAVTEAPVLFPYNEKLKAGMAFPIKSGDSCLILISETELDEWRTGSKSEGSLRFDLSSAIIIPGFLKSGGGIINEATEENAVILSNKSTKIKIKDDCIEIKGDIKLDGKIICTDDVVAGSVSLQKHSHAGVHGQTSAPS